MAIELTVDLVVFTVRDGSLCVLLAKRRHMPFKNHWAIPGRFVRERESLDEAVLAELEEETGTRDLHFEQLQAFGDLKRDPRGRVVTVGCLAILPAGRDAAPKGGAMEAAWFEVSSLPKLAFDHKKIVLAAVQRLQERVLFSDHARYLLPDEFSLADLRAVSETVLHDMEAFKLQRQLLKKCELIEPVKRSGGKKGKPLFRFKKRSQQG